MGKLDFKTEIIGLSLKEFTVQNVRAEATLEMNSFFI